VQLRALRVVNGIFTFGIRFKSFLGSTYSLEQAIKRCQMYNICKPV